MTKKDKIIIYGSISFLTIAFIIYNNWKKKILYSDILGRIDGGAIKFDELGVWDSDFLTKINATGKPYAKYKQEVIKVKAEALNKALSGLGEDEDAVYSVFEFFNSKVGVNQVVTFYDAKYINDGISLKQRLNNLFSNKEKTKISIIISKKPNVIFL
jgi:hypothetical protein